MEETWKDIIGVKDYQISDEGNVRRWQRWKKAYKLLKPVYVNKYLSVTLCQIGQKNKVKRVHTLVLETFVSGRPEGMEVLHGDGDPLNNRLSNLRWGTHKENVKDSISHGTFAFKRGSGHALAKLNESKVKEIKHLLTQGILAVVIAKKFNVDKSNIGYIKNNKTWRHV